MSPGASTILVGLAASPGIAIGQCWTMERRRVQTPKRRLAVEEVEQELGRFRTALEASDAQLNEVRRKVESTGGPAAGEHTAIIDMHRMMLHDEMLVGEVQRLIREERVNPEWAVKRAARRIKSAFHESADEYFKERRADVDYVGERHRQEPDRRGCRRRRVRRPTAPSSWPTISSPPTRRVLSPREQGGRLVTDVGAHGPRTPPSWPARWRSRRGRRGAGITASAGRGDGSSVDGDARRGAHQSLAGRARRVRARARASSSGEERELLADPRPARGHHRRRAASSCAPTSSLPRRSPACLAHGGEGVGLYRTEFLYLGRRTCRPRRSTTRTTAAILQRSGAGR